MKDKIYEDQITDLKILLGEFAYLNDQIERSDTSIHIEFAIVRSRKLAESIGWKILELLKDEHIINIHHKSNRTQLQYQNHTITLEEKEVE